MMKFPPQPLFLPLLLPYHHEKLCFWTQPPLPFWIRTLEAHPDKSFVRVVPRLRRKHNSASCWGVLTSLLMKALANRMPIVESLNLKEWLEFPFLKLWSLIRQFHEVCWDATLRLSSSSEDAMTIHWQSAPLYRHWGSVQALRLCTGTEALYRPYGP